MKVTETDLATFIGAYIKDHPDFELVKMLNSGSVAKGAALNVGFGCPAGQVVTLVHVAAQNIYRVPKLGDYWSVCPAPLLTY